jgi:hypothetical protein
MPDTPFDVLADEMGAVAARIERECLLRLSSLSSEVQRQLAECEVRMLRMEAAATERLAGLRDGLPGERGAPGEAGAKGEAGERGEVGEQGLQGEPGQPGAKGDKGDKGEPGEAGAKGESGERGEKGDQGEKAETGEKGDRGDKGEAGEKGDRGEPGESGTAGERGSPGEKGDQGPLGQLPLAVPFVEGVHYTGDVVTHRGGSYQAQRDTARIPGEHVDWLCLSAPGADGKSARAFNIRGTYDPREEYAALDVVTLEATWFVARQDAPGPCPGPGWKSGPVGKRGEKGERGAKGDRGPQGEAARDVMRYEIDRKGYAIIPVREDGSAGAAIPVRELFEQFERETHN